MEDDSISHILISLLNSLGLDEEHRQKKITYKKMTQVFANLIHRKIPYMTKHLWRRSTSIETTFFYGVFCGLDIMSIVKKARAIAKKNDREDDGAITYLKVPYITELLSGSRFETTTTEGLSSDLDVIYVITAARVIDDIANWKDDGTITYLMDRTGCNSTFVKLRLCKLPGYLQKRAMSQKFHMEVDGHIIISTNVVMELFKDYLQESSEGEIHGPSFMKRDAKGLEKDHVAALQCNFFPREAEGWKLRQTPSTRTRIDPAIIDDINHCYLVAVGDKNSSTGHLQWRLTFTHIEHRLIHAWNNVQYQCYVLMKFILKGLIKEKVPETLCSYHLKTVMLWMNETYPAEFFVASNFEQCVLKFLQTLSEKVRRRSLPHYFVEECNLFYPKLTDHEDTAQKVLDIIENEIIGNWPLCLGSISICSLGTMFDQCFIGKSALTEVCDHAVKIRFGRTEENSRLHNLPDEHHYLEDRFVTFKSDVRKESLRDVFRLLWKMKKLVDNTTFNREQRELIDFTMKDIICNISLDRIRCNSSMSNKTAGRNSTAASFYIRRYSNSCCVDTALKIAAHFIITGNHRWATKLLDDVESRLEPSPSYKCFHNMQPLWNEKSSVTEFFKHYFGACVEYTEKDIPLVPKGLVYEMFGSTTASPGQNWHNQAVIPCPAYLYFLRILCHPAREQIAYQKNILDKMKSVASFVSYRRETSHNLIGHCYSIIGDTELACNEFRKSLEIKKYDNAALWHLAVMFSNEIHKKQKLNLSSRQRMLKY